MISFSTLFAIAFLASADAKDEILKKLDGAKTDYREVETLHKKSIEKAFDALEEAARKDGSKKAVDAAKQSREVFKLWGDYPASVPRAAMADARARLIKAYQDAISGLIMAKADAEAEKLEKEFNKFRIESAVLAGKYTYVSKMKAFNVKFLTPNDYSTNGMLPGSKVPLMFKDLPAAHSIFNHTKAGDHVDASYNLMGKYHTFRAVVGVPRFKEADENPAGAPVFELIGDGKSLWKSKPVEKIEDFQTVEVSVEKVKVLILAIHCPGINAWGRTVWFEPILIEP